MHNHRRLEPHTVKLFGNTLKSFRSKRRSPENPYRETIPDLAFAKPANENIN